MDVNRYKNAIMSYYTDEVLEAIRQQDELMQVMFKKQEAYETLKSRILDLYIEGGKKLQKKQPKLFLGAEDKTRFEIGHQVTIDFLYNKNKHKKTVNIINEIPEIKEAGSLEPKMFEIELDFYKSFIQFNNKIIDDRKVIFTKEYQEKIDEYAETGWFFNYLASPDLPLLHDFCDEQYICEAFTFKGCYNIKTLLSTWFTQKPPSESMRRKTEDLIDVINLINNKGYRTAARNVFALLESESKNCSNAFRNIENKRKTLRTGVERAEEIERIINSLNIEWHKGTWKAINGYYKKAASNTIYPGIINRNRLIHGDYYDEHLDVSLKDVIKLLMLWVNYRMISDFIQYVVELEADLLQYAMVGLAHKISKKNSDTES